MRAALVIALVASLVTPVAAAQDEAPEVHVPDDEPRADDTPFQTAAARALFLEGVALAHAGQYGDAADRFRRAQVLHPAPAVAFNLASALIREGRLVEASEVLESVVRDPASTSELALAARRQRDGLGPRLARLTLRLDAPVGRVHVELDEQPLSDAALGVSVPIDPGVHEVRALREDGEVAAEDRLVLAEGESRELSLVVPGAPLLPESILDPPPAPTQTAEPRGDDEALWIALGVTASVLAAAAITTTVIVLSQPGPAPGTTGSPMPLFSW
jgi:hypothetical protein